MVPLVRSLLIVIRVVPEIAKVEPAIAWRLRFPFSRIRVVESRLGELLEDPVLFPLLLPFVEFMVLPDFLGRCPADFRDNWFCADGIRVLVQSPCGLAPGTGARCCGQLTLLVLRVPCLAVGAAVCPEVAVRSINCLLYTSDAADDRSV